MDYATGLRDLCSVFSGRQLFGAWGITPWVQVARLSIVCVLSTMGLSGCWLNDDSGRGASSGGTNGNHLPVVQSVTLDPIPARLSSPIVARVQAQDIDQDEMTFRYRWFINGAPASGQSSESLAPSNLKRGDSVFVEVVPFDGKGEGAPHKSAVSSVGNTAPIVSNVVIEPDDQAHARRIRINADVVDPDGDQVATTYRWFKNNVMIKEGEEREIDLVSFSATDSVQAEVIATDGTSPSATVRSTPFVMSNAAPKIVSSPAGTIQKHGYEYQVQAQDPDGDPITYALELAPPGMTIHPQTGLVQWTPGAGIQGSHQVRIVAKDPKGGFATQEFDLSLSAMSKS